MSVLSVLKTDVPRWRPPLNSTLSSWQASMEMHDNMSREHKVNQELRKFWGGRKRQIRTHR